MNIETLQKAKELERKIEDYESALGCFEWQSDDGRVDFMKTYIKEGLVRARGELEAL